MLPSLAKMRVVVERMRNLSDVIAVRANSSGGLQLSASTEVVNADITWTNCSHPRIGQSDSSATPLFCICFTIHSHAPFFFFLQLRMAHRRPMEAMVMSRNANDLTQTSSSACWFTHEAS